MLPSKTKMRGYLLLVLSTALITGFAPTLDCRPLDGPSLQAMIDTESNLKLPCGIYVLRRGLTVRDENRHIAGSGPCTVLTFIGGSLEYAIAITASNVELDHFVISAAPGVLARGISMSDVSHVDIHDLTVTGAGTVDPKHGKPAAIRFLNVTDLKIQDNDIGRTGPAAGNARGYDILSDSGASRHVLVTRNHIHGSNSWISIALFNVDDASVESNVIDQNNAFDSSLGKAAGQGCGILLYGAGQRLIARAPGGLVRSGNVVTMSTTTTHSFSVGQHIVINQAISAHGTDFNGDFYVSSVPSPRTLTFAQGAPDDSGGLGAVNPSFHGGKVIANTVTNTAGSGIYLQAYTDSVVGRNVVTKVGQQMLDTSLPAGGIALTSPIRVTVVSNYIKGSILQGISFAAAHSVNVTDNVISAVACGIQARGVNWDYQIKGNTLSAIKHGVCTPGTSRGSYDVSDNIISDGTSSTVCTDPLPCL
jgi:hypothetical protein